MESLYVVLSPNNTAANTYAVAADGTSANEVGATATLTARADTLQLTGDHHFLYTLGSGTTDAAIAVYATDASGAPKTPALQTTTVALRTGFLIHPSGRFAYEMKPLPSDFLSVQSALYLEGIDATTGKLNGNEQQLQSFGPSCDQESLLRFSKDGTALYDEVDCLGPHASGNIGFRKSAVDPATGALTLGPVFWQYSYYNDQDVSRSFAVGDKLLAFARIDGSMAQNSGIGIFAVSGTATSSGQTPLVQCTAQMLAACATTTDVRLDPSEQYVFATDSTSSKVRVLRIDLANKQLVDTGNSIPRGTSDTSVVFSADGKLVYAPMNGNTDIQVYRFDATTGALTAGAVIHVGSTFSMFPAP